MRCRAPAKLVPVQVTIAFCKVGEMAHQFGHTRFREFAHLVAPRWWLFGKLHSIFLLIGMKPESDATHDSSFQTIRIKLESRQSKGRGKYRALSQNVEDSARNL